MKTIINLCIIFIISLTQLLAQEQHTFSSMESIFSNWIKRNGQAAFSWGNDYHRVGELYQTYWYEIRNFNCWQWTYNEIPTEATVISVTIKFRVSKGNYPDKFTFSLHNIPHILNEPNIDFFNKCNSNQIYLSPALIPDENHNVFFNQTFTAQTPVGQGREVWNAVNNAVQSGSYFLTLGIREQVSLLLPYWTISGYNLSVPSSQPCVELTIVYNLPNVNVKVDQKLSTNTSVGTVGLWNKSLNDFDYFSVPHTFNWEVISTTTKTMQGDQSILSSQKYHHWENNFQIDNDVVNHKTFMISTNTQNLTSRFNPTVSGITIKNEFPEVPGLNPPNDSIGFFDPWLIDYHDPLYGNIKRNRGMDAQFKQRPSPFTPDYSTSYDGDVYKGVFLNQFIEEGLPYYSVKAVGYQDINLGGSIGTRRFIFQNWSASPPNSANFQSANASETPVVFKNAGAVVQANLKGTGISNQTDAYNSNSQRKAVRLLNTNYLLNVYKSLDNKIWLEQSSDNGQTWFFKNNNNPLSAFNSEEINPSIDWIPWTDVSNKPFAALVYGSSQAYLTLNIVRTDQTLSVHNEDLWVNWGNNVIPPITPVIAVTSNKILVICNGGMDDNNKEGLQYFYGTISHNNYFITINWIDGYSEKKIIPGTTQYSNFPTIVADKNAGNLFYIAWQENGDIKYCKATGSSGSISFTSVQTPSASSGWKNSRYPSISLTNGNPVISWTVDNGSAVGKIISGEGFQVQKRAVIRRGPVWGDFQIVGSNVNYTNNNSVTSSQEKTVMVWSEGTTNPQSKWITRTGSSYSTPQTLSHSGIHTQLINSSDYQNMTAIVFNNNQLPYYFIKSTTDFSKPVGGGGGGINKISSLSDTVVTFGRAGIVSINGLEFVFNTGDIIVEDSIISFIDKQDTLIYLTDEQLNQVTKSKNFELNNNSSFYFSNMYYVVNSELAASSLSENDNVNFRVELVRASDSQVVGEFDNISYNKNNLEKYANIFYQVNCSNIQQGEYFLRLVTKVESSSPEGTHYALANLMNGSQELEKKLHTIINFTGEKEPITYELFQNYPNPFNPTTTIKYQLPKDGFVTLKVYDILGSEVATLVNEEKTSGRYEVSFNASQLASGVYIYKLQSGEYISSKKMMLLK